jgi:hypothetical protein
VTHFLVTDENPSGYRLEDILGLIRNDIIKRATKIMDDAKPEARHVLDNNIKILGLLSQAIALAEDSTKVLSRHLGPPVPGQPRIGKR